MKWNETKLKWNKLNWIKLDKINWFNLNQMKLDQNILKWIYLNIYTELK